jgi:hypothetical protein
MLDTEGIHGEDVRTTLIVEGIEDKANVVVRERLRITL